MLLDYKKTTVGLPADLLLRLQVYAKISGRSQQDIVAEALERLLPKSLTLEAEKDGKYAA